MNIFKNMGSQGLETQNKTLEFSYIYIYMYVTWRLSRLIRFLQKSEKLKKKHIYEKKSRPEKETADKKQFWTIMNRKLLKHYNSENDNSEKEESKKRTVLKRINLKKDNSEKISLKKNKSEN